MMRTVTGYVVALVAVTCTACQAHSASLIEVFPHARQATPWVLDGGVWQGTFDAAKPALGDDFILWRANAPESVWLARYVHQANNQRKVIVRVFAFASHAAALDAYNQVRATTARPFVAGDAACWTEDGLLVAWGRLVFEIFASDSSRNARPEQVVSVLALIENRMDPDLLDEPR